MTDTDEVLIAERDGLGLITLNRPKAINALNHAMVLRIAPILHRWAVDETIRAVVLTGAGERGLCAGGDVVAMYRSAQAGDSAAADFWRDEYLLNAAIARFPKPYVAVMDGIVMGGGVGVSAHGDIRIVTERSMVGMPEVGIGFVPDVGGTHLLAHAPGELGTHLALTTTRMSAGDAIAAGFADYFVPSDRIGELSAALHTDAPESVVARFATAAPESELAAQRSWIDACYRGDRVEQILEQLHSSGEPAAAKAAEQILAKSPTALAVTLRALRQARTTDSLEANLDREYRVSLASLRSHDLIEGIRAQVIDKDRNPQWFPAALADVTDADVDSYFAHLGDRELGLSGHRAGGS